MSGRLDFSNKQAIMRYLQDPSGVADLLTETTDDTGDSPAQIVADVINVIRADQKMLAQAHGVELEVNRMTPERAGQILAGTINGGGVELVELFNELEDQRAEILHEVMDAEEFEEYHEQKRAMLYTGSEE